MAGVRTGRTPTLSGELMNWFGRCARGAAVCLVAVGAVGCSDDSGDNANFTDRPGQNAPADSEPSSSTVTTTDRGGMGTTGDDTGGQVKN
jgi:hypothetical protein